MSVCAGNFWHLQRGFVGQTDVLTPNFRVAAPPPLVGTRFSLLLHFRRKFVGILGCVDGRSTSTLLSLGVVGCALLPSLALLLVVLQTSVYLINNMSSQLNEFQNATVGMTVGVIEVCTRWSSVATRLCGHWNGSNEILFSRNYVSETAVMSFLLLRRRST